MSECVSKDGKPGTLRLTAQPSDIPARIEMQVCPDCLYDMCEALRAEGFTRIIAADPINEARILQVFESYIGKSGGR